MKYNIIYADPPWSFSNKKTGGSMKSGAENKYPVMTLKDIKNLPVESIAADDCILFMWWVGSQPQEALDVVKAWGFTLKTMTGFNWVKLTKLEKMFFGMGFWTRAGSENCLIATKGKPKPACKGVRSVRKAIAGKHSVKPDEFRDDIVKLCGDIARVELFARQKVDSWHCWGNEVDCDIDLNKPAKQKAAV